MIRNFLGISAFASIIISIAIISIFLWIWALVDCIGSRRETSEKLIWILVIIFLNVLGAIIYLAFNFSKKDTRLETNQNSSSKVKGKAKRLFRSKTDKVLGGVCGGIADYFNTDPTFIRLAVVLLFFINGSTFLAYLIAWLI
ncbi:MAG: PspC domain-containing protein, partial [Candidatus Nanoarchaeia archaeon]|nr:PspC domain-containing protein [Candidatus Nanoarchaeia archaeon]